MSAFSHSDIFTEHSYGDNITEQLHQCNSMIDFFKFNIL